MIQIIGVPFDHCGRTHGSRMGPFTVRLEGLKDNLEAIGHEVRDTGDVVAVDAERIPSLADRQMSGVPVYSALRRAVESALQAGEVPLVIGGDHSISIGSVSGALAKYGAGLGVLWIDAHMDLNTPTTSPSGNLHGMPLAALLRLGGDDDRTKTPAWGKVLDEVVPADALRQEALAWVGLRDVDDGEVSNLDGLAGPTVITMQDVDRMGVTGVASSLVSWIEDAGIKALWVSFDVDSLDPIYAPGTGTAVRGGLSYREAHFLAEALYDITQSDGKRCELAGVDLVEVNPMRDNLDETAKVAVEWAASLFGKAILGRRQAGRTERS